MDKGDVLVFPDAATGRAASSIDPALLMALQNNGGFGGNGFWWVILMWMMWQRNGGNGNFQDYLAQQNGSEGRQYLAEIMNGRFDNLGNLANILNTNVSTLQNMLFTMQSNIQNVAANVNLTAAQTQNAISLGNAALARQLCECCCENRLAIEQQTNAIQTQAASNFAARQLQSAQNHAEDRLDVCQQTNELKTQSISNTQIIKDAIAAQSIMINDKFCDLEKRELQNKINTQGDIITQLRGQLDNDRQTAQLYAMITPIANKLNEVAAKQPNTVPVEYPNLTAVNNTPYIGQGYYPGGYPGFGYGFNNGFGGGIIF